MVKFFKGVLFVASSLFVLQASAAPKVESWITDLGAKVMYVHAEALPMVDIRVVFDAGSARDSALPGLAAFTNGLLTEGSNGVSAGKIAVRLEDRGIEIGNGSLRDMAWLTMRSLTDAEALDVGLETLSDMLAMPNFDEKAVARVRQQMQVGVRAALQSPSSVAQRRFYDAMYSDHPYATPSSGTEESISAITIDDLRAYHRQYYVAANAVISIVGDVNREQAESIANQVVSKLNRGQHAPELPEAEVRKQGELRQSFPSSQTHIYIGQMGMARHDPDYFALYVGNHILGGSGLNSVLGEEVRNKRGLSYSVYSYFSPMSAAGPFVMVAQTKNAQADEAIDVMRETLRNYVAKGPTQEQLDEAKKNIIGGFPLQISSNKKIVNYISMMGFYDHPLDWLETITGKMDAVSVSDVWSTWQRRIDPDQQAVVVVGGK